MSVVMRMCASRRATESCNSAATAACQACCANFTDAVSALMNALIPMMISQVIE